MNDLQIDDGVGLSLDRSAILAAKDQELSSGLLRTELTRVFERGVDRVLAVAAFSPSLSAIPSTGQNPDWMDPWTNQGISVFDAGQKELEAWISEIGGELASRAEGMAATGLERWAEPPGLLVVIENLADLLASSPKPAEIRGLLQRVAIAEPLGVRLWVTGRFCPEFGAGSMELIPQRVAFWDLGGDGAIMLPGASGFATVGDPPGADFGSPGLEFLGSVRPVLTSVIEFRRGMQEISARQPGLTASADDHGV